MVGFIFFYFSGTSRWQIFGCMKLFGHYCIIVLKPKSRRRKRVKWIERSSDYTNMQRIMIMDCLYNLCPAKPALQKSNNHHHFFRSNSTTQPKLWFIRYDIWRELHFHIIFSIKIMHLPYCVNTVYVFIKQSIQYVCRFTLCVDILHTNASQADLSSSLSHNDTLRSDIIKRGYNILICLLH